MSEIRRFMVLQNTYGRMSIYEGKPLMNKGEIVDVEVLENNIHVYNNWRFHPSWFDMWLNVGCLKEILPDKKPISTEENTNIEEDIYSKKYNIYEILILIPNLPKDTKFKCSLDDRIWDTCGDTTLQDEEVYPLEGEFHLKDILEATYTIVKPVEEVKEKWVRINSYMELANAISKGKEVVAFNTHTKATTIRTKVFTDAIIDELFKQLACNYIEIKYLEEN